MSHFDTVLIANRGEIACRIIRTLREMGLQSIAVYSDADCNALHVKEADQAVHIGASPASESYLNIDKIIEVAKTSGAQAIHPGYGFLSETTDFAQACANAGLIFIGPSPDAIATMGDKAVAKRRMIKAGVPCVPGYQGEAQDNATLIAEAQKIGFPIMVKAAAGGGGRGMRLVKNADALPDALADARSEALNAFGSDILILERAIIRPRHVEIQIFGDAHGDVIHLGERDCSIQRRHQKIIEESPCPIMTSELRSAMGEAAIQAARSVDYLGAGTVEFILDTENNFYFLEMNTRLQVEHPVTEIITGLDLVALQIRVAQGEPIGLTQNDIQLDGHAIEMRLYAEDPARDFLPATGILHCFDYPDNIRVDHGISSGDTVSPFYDPMIAKLIAHGPDRATALRRLRTALVQTNIFGVATNRDFIIQVLSHSEFVAGNATTAFIDEQFSKTDLNPAPPSEVEVSLAAVAQFQYRRDQSKAAVPSALLNWRTAHPLATPFIYGDRRVDVIATGRQSYESRLKDTIYDITCTSHHASNATYVIANQRYQLNILHLSEAEMFINFGKRQVQFTDLGQQRRHNQAAVGAGDIRAPMYGQLVNLFIRVGQFVRKGERLAVLEAMKMQHEILADIDGNVTDIYVAAGDQVAANAPLATLNKEKN